MKEKTIITEFVFVGNDFMSKERSLKKEQKLIEDGYKLVSQNSKKKKYIKEI